MSLVDSRQNLGLGRLDPNEDGEEAGVAHQRENVDLLCDVQRRLTGELQRISPPLLPVDQMRQQIARRLAVTDEIVVDEIDYRRMIRLGDEGVELGQKLLGRLEAWLAAIEGRDIAEFAPIRATAGELERADEIAREWNGIVERKREVRQRQPLSRLEPPLGRRRFETLVKSCDQFVSCVTNFPEVQVVELRVGLRTALSRER